MMLQSFKITKCATPNDPMWRPCSDEREIYYLDIIFITVSIIMNFYLSWYASTNTRECLSVHIKIIVQIDIDFFIIIISNF